jgi:sarcosine oxidase subunit beta
LQDEGGFAHHDAVVWAYADAAARLGVEIHPYTAVTDINVTKGAVTGIDSTGGRAEAPVVVNAAGGAAPAVGEMAGVSLPTVTWRVQALVTESLKPFLRPAVSLKPLLGYCHQTTRGEFVGGTEQRTMHPSEATGVDLNDLRDTCQKMVHAFPRLAAARVVRAWSGNVDVTEDFAPILDRAPEVDGLWLDCGWVYGFMGAPAAGLLLAEAICTGKVPSAMRPFSIDRFSSGRLLMDDSLVVSHRAGDQGHG